MKRLTLLLALSFALPGCFPTFPDEGAIKNLRTIAIQQDPAVAILDGQSIPQVTLRALVVDPLDPEGDATTHTWLLDLPDDFEDTDLVDGLIPDGPWGAEVDLNFAALLGGGAPPEGDGARDELLPPEFLPVDYNSGLLPLTHFADNDDKNRESLKFLNFIVPDFESLPTPPTVPGSRPMQAYLEALAAAGEAGPPESWNANPNITKITVNQGEQSFEEEQILEHEGFLDLGVIEGGSGLRFDVEVADDKDQQETDVEIYWTHGVPGLPAEETDDDDGGGFLGNGGLNDAPSCYEPKDGDPEAQDGEGFGGGAGLSEAFEPDRAFGWTAPCSVLNGPIRIFLIARDGEGGMAWQEVRVSVE